MTGALCVRDGDGVATGTLFSTLGFTGLAGIAVGEPAAPPARPFAPRMAREFCHKVFWEGFRLCPLVSLVMGRADPGVPVEVIARCLELRGVAEAADPEDWADSRLCRVFLAGEAEAPAPSSSLRLFLPPGAEGEAKVVTVGGADIGPPPAASAAPAAAAAAFCCKCGRAYGMYSCWSCD